MSFYWPISAAHSSGDAVPGSSKWVASQLHAANCDVLVGTEEVHDIFLEGINEINQFMKTALGGNESDVAEILARSLSIDAAPSKNDQSPRKAKVAFAQEQQITQVRAKDEHKPPSRPESVIETVAPNQGVLEPAMRSGVSSPDGSFQKIRLSIRKESEKLPVQVSSDGKGPEKGPFTASEALKITPIPHGSGVAKPTSAVTASITSETAKPLAPKKTAPERSPILSKTPVPSINAAIVSHVSRFTKTPAKTPRKSSNFVSLPPRQPLTISSTIIQSKASKKEDSLHTSPIRRNRFPSMAESKASENRKSAIPPIKDTFVISPKVKNYQQLSPTINPVGSIISRSRNLFFDRTSSLEKPYTEKVASSSAHSLHRSTDTSVYRISPSKRATNRLIKTPNRPFTSRSSLASSETSKATSRSPTRYDTKHSKNSSVTSTRDEDIESSVEDGKSATNGRFMSPTKSSNAKTTKPPPLKLDDTTKNRFLTTTLNPDTTKLAKVNAPSIKSKAIEERTRAETVVTTSKKKSLMAQRSEAAALQPKKKIIISMNHKDPKLSAIGNVPSLVPSVPAKPIEKPPLVETKRRPLAGNAIALPDAARPGYKVRSVLKRTAVGHHVENSPPVNVVESILPNDELPDINTDDEDNASSKILKSWARSPELHRLVLRNRDVDPKSVFGEVPPFKIEELFESEASRLRGAPSPLKPIRGSDAKRFKSSYL